MTDILVMAYQKIIIRLGVPSQEFSTGVYEHVTRDYVSGMNKWPLWVLRNPSNATDQQ